MKTRLRSIGCAITGALACVALPLAMVSVWTAAVVTDTDRYVATVAPLADDPVVQEAAQRRVTDAVLERVDLDALTGRLDERLPERVAGRILRELVRVVAALAEQRLPDLVERTVERVVSDPAFAAAWVEANRSAHEQLVAVLSGEGGDLAGGRVTISLATVVNGVLDELEQRGFERVDSVPTLEASFTLVQQDDLERASRAYRLVDRSGVLIPMLFVALVLACLLLARNRRRVALRIVLGSLVGVVLLAIALRLAREQVVSAVGGVDASLVEHVWRIILGRLRTSIQLTASLALVLALALWLAGPSQAAVAARDGARSVPTTVRGWTQTSGGAVAVPVSAGLLLLALLVWVI